MDFFRLRRIQHFGGNSHFKIEGEGDNFHMMQGVDRRYSNDFGKRGHGMSICTALQIPDHLAIYSIRYNRTSNHVHLGV